MKKNISINLFGTLYNIDEDAYNMLENYLDSMKRYFSRQESGEEVADDIEHRVAELLWRRREAGMNAVNIETVREIIDTIGNAEQIAGESGSEGNSTAGMGQQAMGSGDSFREDLNQFVNEAGKFAGNTYDRGYNYVRSRKYYRCVDDKILGGVCSGAAAYFNIADPLPIRLGAIIATLLLIGLPLPIIYIVMWLATPAALTPEDRLRQQGREVTPENITLQVKEESQKALMPRGETHKGCLIALIIVIFIVFALLFVGPLMAFIGVFFGILSKMPF